MRMNQPRNNSGCINVLVYILCVAVMGPFGILVAMWIISMMSGNNTSRFQQPPRGDGRRYYTGNRYETGGYNTSTRHYALRPLVAIFATIMKADGRVMRSELNYVREALIRQFPPSDVQRALIDLRDMLKTSFRLSPYLMTLRHSLTEGGKTSLLHVCFELAGIDGVLNDAEIRAIREVAAGMGVSSIQFENILSRYQRKEVDYYQVLGISRQATNDEVKRAFREAAQQYHPDRYAQASAEKQQQATEKFKKINRAYEEIKKQRGMK